MQTFEYVRAADARGAIDAAARAGARYLGGGTNLVDLMRENIETPRKLVDVTALASDIIERADGGVRIGAAMKNTALAENRMIRERYPLIARAVLAGASAQIRNMATVGGNLLQRTRCHYFYDDAMRCNKRTPGAGCDAREGFNRIHAILGSSAACVATHPSDLCVALAALDAVVHVEGPDGARKIPFEAFHLLPGDHPEVETSLRANELITSVSLPPADAAARTAYRKVRDRASYAFALVSVAASVTLDEGVIADVRIAFGGVAHKPWRARQAEDALKAAVPSEAVFLAAADRELAGATPLRDNAFKIDLAKRTLCAVLKELCA